MPERDSAGRAPLQVLHRDAALIETRVAVLGAGAAGLAAGRVLGNAGVDAIVLEGRDRIGGRILTRDDPDLPVPVELGAEFVHGTPPVTLALARAAGVPLVDTAEASFAYENGELRESEDAFALVATVMAGVAGLRSDVSIAEFTATLGDRERRIVRSLIEGFDAADPERAGTRAIAEEWSDQRHGQTSASARPAGGYAALLRTLRSQIDDRRVGVMLGATVRSVRRRGEGVEVDVERAWGRPVTVRARAAIVTFPLGVLQRGDVRFDPVLPAEKQHALSALVMGPVVKLALRFRSRWWERASGERYREAAFFYGFDGPFPTYWTLLPHRAPVLIAWAGGPRAEALAHVDEARRVTLALDALQALFGGDVQPHAELEAAYAHDWQRDRFARGAYSYVAVGGDDARAALARAVDGVLFFAGEATSTSGEAGTVAGALETGERAARETLASALGRTA